MRGLTAVVMAFVVAATGCGVPEALTDAEVPTDVELTSVALTGQNGALVVTTADQVVNQYGVLAANVAVGATTLTVTTMADFTATAPFTTGLAAGDLLLLYQPQGATINSTTPASNYGAVTALNGAGNYELVHVASVAGTTITLQTTGCGGLDQAYTTAGGTQVIRVPQVSTLSVSGAGSIVARPWDGVRGGVVAIQTQTTATIDGGGIDASGRGFRGGALDNATQDPGTTTVRSPTSSTGAEKGESIAGDATDYDSSFNGRYGRGAPANGGGGGAATNAGGGGGANGNSGAAWTGAGVMDGSVVGAAAWTLDPDFTAVGALTTSSGGGRGGYSYSNSNQNALTTAPGNAAWIGDDRRNVGGRGGRPLTNLPATRLFLGGGGGAGDADNTAGGAGGRGGGLVLLLASTVTGTGTIAANGAAGGNAAGNPGDAPGGGGGGGTIVVQATTLAGVTLRADGGTGGLQTLNGVNEAEGPGGGGGGGFIALAGGSVTTSAAGAVGGTTTSLNLSEFPANGATGGAGGTPNAVAATPICLRDDVAITNSDGATSVTAGQVATYTVTVSNPGADVVTGATVTDTFPATLTNVTWTCAASAGSSCPGSGAGDINAVVTLGPGGTVTFTITTTVSPSATGTVATTATVAVPASSGVSDPNAANNTATDSDTITVSADLAIAISDAPDPVLPSGTVTYTIDVTNLGASTATSLTVTDVLPAGVAFVSASGFSWTCVNVADTVSCTRASLPPGAPAQITLVVTAPATEQTFSNTATIAATSADPVGGNNSATTTTTVAGNANLAIAITDAPDPVVANGSLTYTVNVSNAGPNPASSVVVTDALPAGATFVSASGLGWTCAQAGGTVTCTRATLATGAAPAIAIVVTAPAATGSISNTASVATATADPVPGNNSATITTTVSPSADLAIAISDAPDPVTAGGTLTYTIAVSNAGPSVAASLTMTDPLPAGATFVSATGTGWTCAGGGTVTCTRASLAVGAAPAITLTVSAPSAGGSISNPASISATTFDAVAANNTASTTTTVTASADLAIAISDAPDPVAAGGSLTYTVTVSNTGPSDAASITVTDVLPAGVTFTSGTGTGWSCAQSAGTVTCSRASVAVGAAPALTIIVTVPTTPQTITNTVTVVAGSADPVAANNTATTTTSVVATADLAITIADAPDPIAVGANLTYSIAVRNIGPNTATGIVMTDTLSADLTFVSAAGLGWACSNAGQTVTCARGPLGAGSAPVIEIVATPQASGLVTNTVSVAGSTSDNVPGNNVATAVTTVDQAADLSIAIEDAPDPVAVGATLTYTLTVTNAGPSPAATVSVAHAMPLGTTFISATGTGWTCAPSGLIVTCTRATVALGVSPITVVVTAPTTAGTLTSTATVSAVTADIVPGNNTASTTTTVEPRANLAIAVTDTPDPVTAGTQLTYTLAITSAGPSTALGISVVDTLPAGVTALSATGTGWLCPITGLVVTCTRSTVSAGGAPPITIVVTAPDAAGSLTNTATIASTTIDPDTADNTATTTTQVTASGDVSIAISDAPDPVTATEALAYTIAVTNPGPSVALDAVVTTELPSEVALIGTSATGWTCATVGQTVTCTSASLDVGAAPPIVIDVTAPAAAPQTLTATTSVVASTADPDVTNNTAMAETAVTARADLAIGLTGGPSPIQTGATATYAIAVSNAGPSTATALVVTNPIPAGATFVSAAGEGWTCTPAATRVTCARDELAATLDSTITLLLTVPSRAGSITDNVTLDAETPDPDRANNVASVVLVVEEPEVPTGPNVGVRGGGCDAGGTSGSSGVLILLAVAGLARRRRPRRLALAVALPLVLAAGTASAQFAGGTERFPIERMRLATDRDGILAVEWAGVPGPFTWNLSTWVGYADDPLTIYDRDTDQRVGSLVKGRIGGGLVGGVGITSWLAVGIDLPLIYDQSREVADTMISSLASPKVGDLRLAPKLVVVPGGDGRVGVAVMLALALPTGGSAGYAGDDGVTVLPELIVSHARGPLRMAANLGYLARTPKVLGDLIVDDEIYARLGVGYRFGEAKAPFELDLTAQLATAAADPYSHVNTDPFEVAVAALYDVRPGVSLFGVGGVGLNGGFGTPDWRALAGIRYQSRARTVVTAPLDSDGDGILDLADNCPDAPEDKDGFEDGNGCPELDNDKDGLADAGDRCPLEPEDKDNHIDDDGCADPDNDNDGVLDVADTCPAEPEDMDGFTDDDGCPDPDNDSDGTLDRADRCPAEAGPAFTDGCPDPDRDADSIVDRLDNCPDEKGPAEFQGCPQQQLVTIKEGKLELLQVVYFRTARDIIEPRSFMLLDNVAKVLVNHPEIAQIRVEGHTDNQGDPKRNHDLSQRRADAVVKYLAGKRVERGRLLAVGFGQRAPIDDNATPQGRTANRRVEFVIVGGPADAPQPPKQPDPKQPDPKQPDPKQPDPKPEMDPEPEIEMDPSD